MRKRVKTSMAARMDTGVRVNHSLAGAPGVVHGAETTAVAQLPQAPFDVLENSDDGDDDALGALEVLEW